MDNKTSIFIDADGCPVKEEVYRVAKRHQLQVLVVANAWMKVPAIAELILVGDGFDAADDWIVEHIEANDIVVTADIPLAARCLAKKARGLKPKGKRYTQESIGGVVAQRNLLADLRESGVITGGPAPFSNKDRSRFLQNLENLIREAKKP
ncbi:YaiI/YqxD family protein [Planctomycetota bacterium]